ncbi:MAG TPA: toxin-antitoxin system YwqK family antitoxin [Firmicutes bacterium]|nr:toxin-antitoxin system YwqK family antitoxin [Bacillota bacterium]
MDGMEKMIKKGFFLVLIALTALSAWFLFRFSGGNILPVAVAIAIAVFFRRQMARVDDDMPSNIMVDEAEKRAKTVEFLKKAFDTILPAAVILFILLSSSAGQRFIGQAVKKAKEIMAEQQGDHIKKEYYEDGSIKKETPIIGGKKEGAVKAYYKDGSIYGIWPYKQGKLEGQARVFFEGGSIKEEWEYKNGNLHGTSVVYHENGKVKKEQPYENDKLHGIYRVYNEKGIMIRENLYKEGEMHGYYREYDGEGNMIAEKIYENGREKIGE